MGNRTNSSASIRSNYSAALVRNKQLELDRELKLLRSTIDSTNKVLTKATPQSSVMYSFLNLIFSKETSNQEVFYCLYFYELIIGTIQLTKISMIPKWPSLRVTATSFDGGASS